MTITFNVILPTVRRPSLEAAIESVLAQDYPNLELLVVIDGSDQEPVNDPLIEKYGPEGVSFIGVSNGNEPAEPCGDSGTLARREGINETSEDWIAYIDDDDIWHPNHLTTLASLAILQPEANMVRSAGQEFKLKHKHPRSSKRVQRLGPVNTDDPLTVGMAHTRELYLKTVGWQPEDNHDHRLWADMKAAGGISAISQDVTFIFKR